MRPGRAAGGASAALALVAALVLGSRLPWRAETSDAAVLRLSWRSLGQRVEACREPTEEELAALPRHMRMSRICEGRIAPFRLRVAVDGETRVDAPVHASGAREDRPAYVLRELRLAPGEHRVSVRFEVEPGVSASDVPVTPPLVLDETLRLAPREVALVTHDPDADRLVLVHARPARSGPP